MKSKTSFFNRTVFQKNFTLFWPIWVGLLLIELLRGPGHLWVRFHSRNEEEPLYVLEQNLSLEFDICLLAVAAAIIGMALFHYLCSAKSANWIHALPVTRLELYGTNLLSGLTFLFVPLILSFLGSVMVCLSCGVAQVQYLLVWFLACLGIAFFFFAEAVFCAMFTGQMFALPVYFLVCNFLVVGVAWGLFEVVDNMTYGLTQSQSWTGFELLSPFVGILDRVGIVLEYTTDSRGESVPDGFLFSGGKLLFAYVLVAFVLYLVAYFCYRKRPLECAGDILVFDWVKPLFRWGVGACVGFFCGSLLALVLDGIVVGLPTAVWLVLVLILGSLAFFVAQMLIEKAFRVVNRRRLVECGIFLCFLAVGFGGIYGYSYQLSRKIPKADEVEYAYVCANYPVEFSGDEVELVTDLHREILTKREVFEREIQSGDYAYVNFIYYLKDGSSIKRYYNLPAGADSSERIFDTIRGWEREPENFLNNWVQYGYEEVERFTDLHLEWLDTELDTYVSRYGGSDAAAALYEAVRADLDDGVLQKYNLSDYGSGWGESSRGSAASLGISFYYAGNPWQTMYDRMYGTLEDEAVMPMVRGTIALSFGEDCTHMIDALVTYGVVESREEIQFPE